MTQPTPESDVRFDHVFAAWSRLRTQLRYWIPSKHQDIRATRRAIRRVGR